LKKTAYKKDQHQGETRRSGNVTLKKERKETKERKKKKENGKREKKEKNKGKKLGRRSCGKK
jgi:hypothetical protein